MEIKQPVSLLLFFSIMNEVVVGLKPQFDLQNGNGQYMNQYGNNVLPNYGQFMYMDQCQTICIGEMRSSHISIRKAVRLCEHICNEQNQMTFNVGSGGKATVWQPPPPRASGDAKETICEIQCVKKWLDSGVSVMYAAKKCKQECF